MRPDQVVPRRAAMTLNNRFDARRFVSPVSIAREESREQRDKMLEGAFEALFPAALSGDRSAARLIQVLIEMDTFLTNDRVWTNRDVRRQLAAVLFEASDSSCDRAACEAEGLLRGEQDVVFACADSDVCFVEPDDAEAARPAPGDPDAVAAAFADGLGRGLRVSVPGWAPSSAGWRGLAERLREPLGNPTRQAPGKGGASWKGKPRVWFRSGCRCE